MSPGFFSIVKDINRMLGLRNNWDSDRALSIRPQTIHRVLSWLIMQSEKYENMFFRQTQAPYIDPCPDGSVDIHWKTKKSRNFGQFSANWRS